MKYRYLSIIFLVLVFSIGAVCAQEDAADVAGIASASSDDVLSVDNNADILENELGSGNSIEINDENYNNYFSENGTILENANISDNDTIILGNINDKVFDIDRPLTITSNGTPINNTEITLNKGSDNSIIENLTIMNEGDVTAILVSEAENITIISNKIFTDSIGNNNAMSAVFANLANNLKIMDNIFEYVGRDNDTLFNSNIVIGIVESDGVLIEKNKIQFAVESNATASNKVILASQSNDIVISHNVIGATIPSRSIDWYTGNVYSEGIALDDCNEVTFTRNIMAVKSSGYTGEYDTIYGVHATGNNVSVVGNVIGVLDAPYGYAVVISGEEFALGYNLIYSGVDMIEILNKSIKNFTEYNYDGAAKSGFYENFNSSIDIKTIIDDLISNITTPYACGIEVDGLSTGVIELNMVATAAVSSYGIYTANWAGDVIAEMDMNFILGAGDTVFGMSLSGSESLVETSAMYLFGNYTTGIASTMNNINITSVAINSLGSNEGTPAGYDMMGIETTGIHIVSGDASITNSHVITTGKYAVDFKGEGAVTDNNLTAELLTGDFAVDYIQNSSVLVENNTPEMELNYILTNDTFYVYFDEEGRIREQIVADNLTFMGPFSNLVDKIIIDSPIDLLSDDAVLYDLGIEILSDNVTVEDFTFISDCLSEIICIHGSNNVSIGSSEFFVQGLADDDNTVIHIIDSENILICINTIEFTVETNDTYRNMAILAEGSNNLAIDTNEIKAYLPARSIDWGTGTVYSEGVCLDDCHDVILDDNTIAVKSNGKISTYDTIYAAQITGDNVTLIYNRIGAIEAPYGYALVITGENFNITENYFAAGENGTYACGIDVESNSNGIIDNNRIEVIGDSAYGIYTANWAGDVKANIANNTIFADSNSPFGLSLSGSEALVENNYIEVVGNYTTGIASVVENIVINNNTVIASGSNVGTPLGYDSMGVETTGIHIVDGNAIVTNNNIAANNKYAVDFEGEGEVTDNEIYAEMLTGDFAVDYSQDANVLVANNTPVMELDYKLTNDTFYIYFDEKGIIRQQIETDNLTFIGEFSNLVEEIFINKPVALLSENATLNNISFVIESGDVSVDGFNFTGEQSGISVDCGDNVKIMNNNFDIKGFVEGTNVVIEIYDSDNVLIENNNIKFLVETNGTFFNNIIYAQDSDNLSIIGNNMTASLPARSINWTSGEVYSQGVFLNNSDNAVLERNIIGVKSNDQISTYDTIHAVNIKGDNATLTENRLGVVEAPYGYALVMTGENFNIANNMIIACENGTYACGIDVESNSNGVIDNNLIYAVADVAAYGIYTANWNGDVKTNITNNIILADANSPFGLSLSGSEALVENNGIEVVGNYTTGIASVVEKIAINNNTIIANGSNVGTPLGYDSMGVETTGIHIADGNAKVTNNNVTTTGEFAVDLEGTGQVTENYLVADVYTGDASVKYTPDQRTMVQNNTPSMQRAIISANDIVMYYKNGTRYVVTLTDQEGNPLTNKTVTLTINGDSYIRTTDENGTTSLAINLDNGNYTISASYVGESGYSNASIINNVTVLSTIYGKDIVKMFKNATQYSATFVDGQGNPLASGTEVTFNINGVFYTRTTDASGQAQLNINLEPGTYILTAIAPNGEMRANNITVLSTIGSNNLVKYYRNGSQFIVTIYGEDGNVVGAGENVTFNINGVFYTRTTNASGQAQLNINLQPGDYIITTIYNGCMAANNVTVKPVLTADDLVKKYGTSDQFIAYLLDGQGKPYPGQTVQFNIHGLFYDRTTDADGRAMLNIKLDAAPDVYIITSMYNDCSISNKITVIP